MRHAIVHNVHTGFGCLLWTVRMVHMDLGFDIEGGG